MHSRALGRPSGGSQWHPLRTSLNPSIMLAEAKGKNSDSEGEGSSEGSNHPDDEPLSKKTRRVEKKGTQGGGGGKKGRRNEDRKQASHDTPEDDDRDGTPGSRHKSNDRGDVSDGAATVSDGGEKGEPNEDKGDEVAEEVGRHADTMPAPEFETFYEDGVECIRHVSTGKVFRQELPQRQCSPPRQDISETIVQRNRRALQAVMEDDDLLAQLVGQIPQLGAVVTDLSRLGNR